MYFVIILVIITTVVQYLEKYKKNIAIDMRKHGFSYSDIQNKMNVPKSTIAYWVKKVRLTPEQRQKLKERRTQIAKANSEKKIVKTAKLVEQIKASSARDIQKISKRELWLLGIILYWRSKSQNDFKNGVRFTSSDPYLIRLFLKWLRDVGQVEKEEIIFDIFTKKDKKDLLNKTISHWAKVTGFPPKYFTHTYQTKTGQGFLRIRVRASSMLARQIAGWIKGIQKIVLA